MSHSLCKIWIHGIFGTKNKTNLIIESFEDKLYEYIKKHLENDFNCGVRAINGTTNHIHILFLLNPNYSIKDMFKNIKGSSSHWVNTENFISGKFAWQIGYGAFSVSESRVKDVECYITNQKEHHKKITFQEEYNLFIKKHGLFIG